MKNNLIKKGFFVLTLCLGASIAFLNRDFAALSADTGNMSKALPNNMQELVSEMFKGKTIARAEPLYSLDGSEDFVCTEFNEGGYAVFYKESMELLEQSSTGRILKDDGQKLYYGGPADYYSKSGKVFQNIKTKEIISNSTSLLKKASGIRNAFKGHSLKKQITSFSAISSRGNDATGDVPPLDTSNQVYIDSATYNYGNWISNYPFYVISPRYGHNQTGTCGAVAAEMLLTYHNYYNDRRIIPNNYLNGNSTTQKEDNPNYCTDPMRMTHKTLGARGFYEDGSDDSNSYFAKLVNLIPKSAKSSQVTNGLKSILSERKNALGSSFSYTVTGYDAGVGNPLNSSHLTTVRNEIKKGNPCILLMQKSLGGSNHYVVAYGSVGYTYPGTTTEYQGFVTNFGWDASYSDSYLATNVNIWINSAWVEYYSYITINHEHNYTTKQLISGTDRYEYKCSVCNHRTDNVVSTISALDKSVFSTKITFPVNYGTFSSSARFYETMVYRTKEFYYKPTTSGQRIIQTLGSISTDISVYDKDYNPIVSYDKKGYLSNGFINLSVEANKVYRIKVSLFPLRSSGTTRLVVTPAMSTWATFSELPNSKNCIGFSMTKTIPANSAFLYVFVPQSSGQYIMNAFSENDSVIHVFDAPTTNAPLMDDDGGDGYQARLVTNLTAGRTYFIVVNRYNNTSSITVNFKVEKA